MADITSLIVTEVIKVDSRRIHDFITELGEDAASRVVEQATQRLQYSLTKIEQAVTRLDLRKTATQSGNLSRLAWQIGLVSLSNVATDLGNCAEQDNIEALLVVKARIMRVGQRSLTLLQNAKEVGLG